MIFDKDIGNIGEDTFVGVNFAHAWNICIFERFHKFSELDIDEVDKFIDLLKEAKEVLIEEKKKSSEYSEKPKEESNICEKCKLPKVRCFAEAMKYDANTSCKCSDKEKKQ